MCGFQLVVGYCVQCQIYPGYSDRVAPHSEGVPVSDCPLGLKVCYPSCYWWQDGKCIFKKEAEMVENEITLSLAKSQAVLVAFLVGEFYRFMVKEGVSEVAIGYMEVADLVDKLSKAVSGLKQS